PGHQHAYWLVSPDGSTTRFLTDGAAFNGAPAWSPDSSELLYFAPDDSLHAIPLDGRSDRVVLRGALLLGMGGPAWRRWAGAAGGLPRLPPRVWRMVGTSGLGANR